MASSSSSTAFEATQLGNPVRDCGDTRNQQSHRHHGAACHAEHPVQWHIDEQGHQEKNDAGGDQNAGTGHSQSSCSVSARQGRPGYFEVAEDGATRCARASRLPRRS
jgi:hypothetical protein